MAPDKKFIGRKYRPVIYEVLRGKIAEYALAIKNDDPHCVKNFMSIKEVHQGDAFAAQETVDKYRAIYYAGASGDFKNNNL